MMKLALFLMAALAGLSNPIQSAANAGLNKALGPAVTLITVYGIAATLLLLSLPLIGIGPAGATISQRIGSVPWWAWVGGICNFIFALSGALVTRQIGSASFTVTVLVCATTLSLLLDQFGLLGLEQRTASWERLIGALLAIGGVILITRG